jgi:hypothetical protein
MRQMGIDFDDMINKASGTSESSVELLRQGMRELSASADRVLAQVRGSTESWKKQSRELTDTGTAAVEQVQAALEKLRANTLELFSTGEKVQAKTDSLGAAFDRQVDGLIRASDAAQAQAAGLQKTRSEVDVDGFFKSASFIVEKLNSLAVDIARMFQPDIDDETWRRFHKGDQSIFVRRMVKSLDKAQISAIRGKMEEESEFRGFVTRYVNEFETLIARARTTDRGEIIAAAFTSSDVGKLYLVLARAMGRIEG